MGTDKFGTDFILVKVNDYRCFCSDCAGGANSKINCKFPRVALTNLLNSASVSLTSSNIYEGFKGAEILNPEFPISKS